MQQYRLNVGLLIGLIVGTVIVSAATYGLWLFQIDRNANALIVAGEEAVEAGDFRTAARELANYLSIRPTDDAARVKLANIWVDVTEQPEVQPEDWSRTIAILEDTVRRLPEEKALQRRLVDLYGRINQVQQSLDHLSLMLEKYPDDGELQVLQMEYLMRSRKFEGKDGAIEKCKKLVGYDDKTDKFDIKQAAAPNSASAYSNFAGLLRSVQNKPELADRVMDQLVKVNPELPAAYLQRGQYYASIGEADRGQRDIDKAYKLAPKDADVLLTLAARAESKERPEQAQEYLQAGLKSHSDDPRFYQGLAGLEMREMKYKEALAIIDQGLKAVPSDEGQNLLFYKAELQFLANDMDGVRRTAEEMQKAGFRKEFVDWMEARILLTQGKWYEASQALFALQPVFGEAGMYADQLGNQLGLAYEKSGQYDKADAAYASVTKRSPDNAPAKAGRQRIAAMRGLKPKDSETNDLDEQVAKILQQPKAERNWSAIDKQLTELAEERKLEGAAPDLFWSKLMLMREDFAGARKYLVAGRNKDPENLEIQRTAVLLLRADPSQGADKALRLLDQITDKFGDKPELRLDRVDCLIVLNEKEPNKEQLQAELAKLNEAPADWTENDKITFWNGMAGRYLMLGVRDEAKNNLERVAELRPNELPTRVAIFTLCQANDDVGMRDAQDKLLKVVGSKDDSNWLYSEARRLLSLYRRGQADKESLNDVRQLTELAMKERPNWFELQLVYAEIDMLSGDDKSALDHFEKAQELGRPNANAVLQHVRLLLNSGKYARAKELIETLPKEVREGDLGQVYAEVLFNTGDPDTAVEVIEKFAAATPESAERQLAMGQMITRALGNPDLPEARQKELLAESKQALQKAVELNPESPQMWLALITFQVMSKDLEAAKQSMQQAQLALAEDQLVAVMAKGNEIMGQWFNAENVYLNAMEIQPDNLLLAQELATFYLSNAYPRPDKLVKATPLVNQVLKAGADGKLQPNDASLLCARRAAAQMLAATGQYQELLKAEKLLASSSKDGALPAEDRLRMAEILAPRPEPISRIRAKNLLEAVKRDQQRLSLQHELMLGQLYFAVGDWEKCKSQMLSTVSRFPKSTDARIQYINMILQRGDEKDMNMAVRQMSTLRELAPNDIRTVQLMSELGAKTGQQEKVRGYLLGLLPKTAAGAKLDENQVPLVEFVATQLVKLDDLDNAERLFRQVVGSQPNKLYALADFLGTHRDIAQCMQLLEDNYKVELTDPTLRVGIAAVRAQRDKVGDKYDSQVQGWLDRGLLENPDSVPLLMLQAEFYDVSKKYDEAAKVYEKLLARNDVTGITRAIVLNNLAFLVALAGNEADAGVDPLKLVQEAEHILGPTADILDTRAVVYITQGNYPKAIEDLNYAVTDNPNAPKYFHKAVAHLGAGQNTAALEAWNKAEGLSDDVRSTLNRMEFDLYDKTKAKIEQLRDQKLTRAAG